MTETELEKLENLRRSDLEILSGIAQVYTTWSADDTSGALRNGAVLLGISTVENDEEGEGFRFCIGLPKGVEITPFLSNFFS